MTTRQDILIEIDLERTRQIEKGYTLEHDRSHTFKEMTGYANAYLTKNFYKGLQREDLIKSAAIIVAMIEKYDN